MVSTAARLGGVLGATAAFAIAMARGGLSAWTTGMLTAGALVLLAVVLFVPSETPARRLGRLIEAWRTATDSPVRYEPVQPPEAPPSPARDGS
ncbi:hypothetical protein ACFYNL_35445 [Streptomyces sp. NPDC007808]|uniref:hypothetical protein n=1 Tax=Streptomyces sp. NPDC007808 TaxID=3364779 RepID=UPI0036B6D2F6